MRASTVQARLRVRAPIHLCISVWCDVYDVWYWGIFASQLYHLHTCHSLCVGVSGSMMRTAFHWRLWYSWSPTVMATCTSSVAVLADRYAGNHQFVTSRNPSIFPHPHRGLSALHSRDQLRRKIDTFAGITRDRKVNCPSTSKNWKKGGKFEHNVGKN